MRKSVLGDIPQIDEMPISPCYSGLQDEKCVLVFDNEFRSESIARLIYDIENFRQNPSYNRMDLYFSSNGGCLQSMYRMVDYLNNIENFEINIIVDGEVASAGFYMIFLLENENVGVVFTETSYGMIHLGDTYVSARGQLDKRPSKFSFEKFKKEDIELLNKKFVDLIDELSLSKEEKNHIMNGQDFFLSKDRLEKVYEDYQDKKYFEDEATINSYIELNTQYKQIKLAKELMEDGFKKYLNLDIKKELGIEGDEQ